jgi:repressor LexA
MSEGPPLTHLEARVLAAIERHIRAEGVAPTIAELAADLRLRSKGTVHRYVQSLIGKGRLERHGNGWRGLRIVGLDVPGYRSNVHPFPSRRKSDQAADTPSPDARGMVVTPLALPASVQSDVADPVALPAESGRDGMSSGEHVMRIPLLGRIAAGMPIEAIEDQHYLDLAAFFIGPDRYALRVTGDSMMDVGILDGDTVILRKQETANTGDIVVALIDGQEATLKRLGGVRDGQVELIPENAAMDTMLYALSRVSFQGVLVGQLRNY